MPVSGVQTYCATKTFASYIAEALHYETEGKVDIMSYQAGFVATKLVLQESEKPQDGAITPQKAADTCFRDLGIQKMTRGAFSHEFVGWISETLGKATIRSVCRSTLNDIPKWDAKKAEFEAKKKE